VENIPLDSGHHSASTRKVAALLAESVAVFAAECWPACQRNPGRLPTGTLADFDRIHQVRIPGDVNGAFR
jgi:hypothetical protein